MHTLNPGTKHAASKQQNPLYLCITAHTHTHTHTHTNAFACVQATAVPCNVCCHTPSHARTWASKNQPITPAHPTHCNRQPSSSFGPTVWPSLASAATPPLHSTLTTLPSPPSLTASAHVAAIVRASLDRISVISIFFCSSSSAALPA